MERKRKVTLGDGRLVDATEVGFRASGEHWNEYLADDGTVIRIKLVVTEVLRVDGEYDSEGNPGYLIKSSNVTSISAAEVQRRQS